MAMQPKQVHDMLTRMQSPADQEKYLASLPEADLDAYADWSEQNVKADAFQQGGELPGGYQVQQGVDLDEQKMQELSDEQLDAIANGADPNEVMNAKAQAGSGFLDTGMGLAARGLAKGLGAVGGLVIDPILPEGESVAGAMDSLGDAVGARRPQNGRDRVTEDVFSALAQIGSLKGAGAGLSAVGETSAAAGRGLKGKLARGVGKVGDALQWDRGIKIAPGIVGSEAAVGTALGTGAMSTARENGASDTNQIIAGLIGAVAPGGIKSAKDFAVRKAFGAGTPEAKETIAKNLADFDRVGVPITAAEATGNPRVKSTQRFLSTMFGTGGIVRRAGQAQDAAIEKKALGNAEALAPGADPTEAGMRIREGIEGYTDPLKAKAMSKPADFVFGWRPRQQKIINNAWSRFGREVEPNWMVDTTKLQQTLEKRLRINPNDPGRVASAADGDRAFYQEWYDRLKTNIDQNATMKNEPVFNRDGTPALDSGGKQKQRRIVSTPGKTPFESLQQARTDLGTQIESALLNGEKSAAQLRQMYGLLSDALDDGLKTMDKARGSKARSAWEAASKLTKDYHETLEIIGNVAAKEGGFENVYKLAVGGTAPVPGQLKIGGTRVYQVMKNLDEPQRQIFAGAFLKRLGGDKEFSLKSFIDNFNVMDDNARNAILDVIPATMRKDYETLVRVGSNILEGRSKEGISTLPREGGRGASFVLYSTLALASASVGGMGKLAQGDLPGAALGAAVAGAGAVGGALVIGRALAKKMTDPYFVRWLAKSTELPKSAVPTAITQLAEHARQQNDPELLKLAEYYRQQAQEQ